MKPTVNTTQNPLNPNATSRRLRWLALAGAAAILTVAAVLRFAASGTSGTPAAAARPSSQPDLRPQIREKLRAALDHARAANDTARENFERETAVALRHMQDAQRNVPGAVQRLTTFKSCFKLCYLIAKDKMNQSAEAEEFIQGIWFEYFHTPTLAAAQGVETARVRLADQLAANATELRAAALQPFQQLASGSLPDYGLDTHIAAFNHHTDVTRDIGFKTATGTIGLAIEAILIRQTWKCAVRVLGHIATRLGTTLAAAITAALSDGPLPVGDVIAVLISLGGSAWAAWDIHKAQVTLRDELTTNLHASLREESHRLRKAAEDSGAQQLNAYNETNASLIESLLAQLK